MASIRSPGATSTPERRRIFTFEDEGDSELGAAFEQAEKRARMSSTKPTAEQAKNAKGVSLLCQAGSMEITIIIIIIITYIYNALNDGLSASRIHNKLKTILSKYIYIQNRQS